MNAPASNLPATRKEMPPIVKLNAQLEERADEFRKALPSHISPDKLQRTVMTAAQNNPDLLSADRQSLITSCMKAAQDGLLPDGREAALVIFSTSSKDAQGNWQRKQQVQYMPMVYGLRKKITQSGEIVSLQTGLVYRAEMEAGAFIYEVGMEPPIRHRPMLDLPAEDLTDDKIVAAYSMAKMKDGTISVEVMRRGEIDKVRETSMTGATRDKKGQPRQSRGPWADWFGEMARKTVMRRHSKTLPMSGDVIVDVEGREHEVAASAVQLLDAVEPDAPVALPSPEELDAASEEEHDAETGEVIRTDPQTGMTEVTEDEARELDRREASGAPALDDEPSESQTEAAIAAQALNDIDGPLDPQPVEEAAQADEAPVWVGTVQTIKNGIAAAKNAQGWQAAERMYVQHCVAFPQEVAAELEKILADKKRQLGGGQ